jgi:hypothetical protein
MTDENKTLTKKIVAASPGFGTIAGHALVVVIERDGGRTHYQTVTPEQKFQRPWMSRGTLLPYQVTLDQQLRHKFFSVLSHSDSIHTFTVTFELSYRVLRDSLHVVVTRLDKDPLGSVEEEIKRVLSAPLRALPWPVIHDHEDLKGFAVDATGVDDSGEVIVNRERLRIYGRSFGIDIRDVSVARTLHEPDLETWRREQKLAKERQDRDERIWRLRDETREEKVKYALGTELAITQSELDLAKDAKLTEHAIKRAYDQKPLEEAKLAIERELETTRALNNAHINWAQTVEQYAAGARQAVRDIASSTKTIPEFGNQIRQISDITAFAPTLLTGRTAAGDTGPPFPPGNGAALLEEGSRWTAFQGPARNIEDVLARACEVAAALPAPEPEQRRCLATVLRLQAARMMEDAAEVERLCRELHDIHLAHAQDMEDKHSHFLADLARDRRSP